MASLLASTTSLLAAATKYDQATTDDARHAGLQEAVAVVETYVRNVPPGPRLMNTARELAQGLAQRAPLQALRLQAALRTPRAGEATSEPVVPVQAWSRFLEESATTPAAVGETLARADDEADALAGCLWRTAPTRTLGFAR